MTETIASWHPFVVHFAVALTMASVAFDVLDFFLDRPSLERSGFHLMLAAVPFLLAAVLSGNLAEDYVAGVAPPGTLDAHVTYANIAIWVFSAAAFWRLFLHFRREYAGRRKVAYVFIVTAAAASIFLAAQHGGSIRHRPYITPPEAQRRNAATGISLAPLLTGDDVVFLESS